MSSGVGIGYPMLSSDNISHRLHTYAVHMQLCFNFPLNCQWPVRLVPELLLFYT